MEFEKIRIIMENSWNFVKQFNETISSQKTRILNSEKKITSFLATGGFKF